MIVIGADTHMRSHTLTAVSEATGRVLATKTVPASRRSCDDLVEWARSVCPGERNAWALEDYRHVSGAPGWFLIGRGERVVQMPPKLSAGSRKTAREPSKSDEIDATAIARVAIREGLDNLPVAQLAGPELDVRLLDDHRERLVAQRTAMTNEPRWHLHHLWPELVIPARAPTGERWQQRLQRRLAGAEQTARVRIARDELRRVRDRSRAIDEIEEIEAELAALSPSSRRDCSPSPASAY